MKIKRTIIKEITEWLDNNKILILKGARQVGKTTILEYIQSSLIKQGKKTKYYSLDYELGNPIFDNPKLFVQFIDEQYSDNFVYIFLDEFQYIKNAGNFVKTVYDRLKNNCRLIISGSSSLEITKNSEFLTGRKIDFKVNTLSYLEFSNYCSEYKLSQRFKINDYEQLINFNQIYKEELKRLFTTYINFGGYPEVTTTKSIHKKQRILREIVSTYIQKDVAGFLKVDNISGFNNLLKILTSQIGSLVNKNELCNTLNIGHDTVRKYLDILSGTYVLNYISPYCTNVRKELSKMQKVYISDFGLHKIISNSADCISYNEIPGEIIENFVYLELIDQFIDVKFYRTISKSEIDFIVKNQGTLIPFEVKFQNRVKNNKLPLAIKNFNSYYKNTGYSVIITKDYLANNKITNCYFIPAYLFPFVIF